MGDFKLTRVDPTLPCTAVVLHPEWAVEAREVLDASRHRSPAGRLATVAWERWAEYRVPLRWVAEPEAALLRAWWQAGAALAFTLDTSAQRSTVVCAIANAAEPLGDHVESAADRRAGVLLLASRYPGGPFGQPFILDDPVFGQMDQPWLTLVPSL